MVVDLFRSADLRDSPGVENGDAVGHHHRLLPVVCDMHGGDAEGLLQCLDLVTHLLADARVEIGQRFVKQQDLRVDDQRSAEGNTLRWPPESAVTLRSPSPSSRSIVNNSAIRLAISERETLRNLRP